VEVSALKHPALPGLRGSVPLLRLQSDERLVALVRRGQHSAFEALVARYQARLLAFCRHMLGSREDAEDVLQEVFTAAFNAMIADERALNVRPWLYRIARNRSLNHLRRATAIGVDSMDIHIAEGGESTSDKVFKRESFRLLMADVSHLPESQRTALLLREMDALSYQEISVAMETTIPSVKSLLVRARVSLAEAAEARRMNCDEVRLELGRVAEGLTKVSQPVRRHVRDCERCSNFRASLKANNRALAAIFPVAPLLLMKKLFLAKLGTTASAGGAGATAAKAGGATATAAGTAAAAGGSTGLVTAGVGALATKAAAGLAAAALVTAGAVEVRHDVVSSPPHVHHSAGALAARVLPSRSEAPVVIASAPQVLHRLVPSVKAAHRAGAKHARKARAKVTTPPVVPPVTPATAAPTTPVAAKPTPTPAPTVQQESGSTVLPPSSQPAPTDSSGTSSPPAGSGSPPPSDTTTSGTTTSGSTTTPSSPPPSSGSSDPGSPPPGSAPPGASGGGPQPTS
jgi:RNA polymerase sigma factor (sigma-70 family)